MDDKRIRALVKAAVELEELRATVGDDPLNVATASSALTVRRRFWRLGLPLVGVAAAAVWALWVFVGAEPPVRLTHFSFPQTRGPTEDFSVYLASDAPCWVQFVLQTEVGNLQRIRPDPVTLDYTVKLSGSKVFGPFPLARESSKEEARPMTHLLVLATRERLTDAEVKVRIPHKLAPAQDPASVGQALEKLAQGLRAEKGWTVEYRLIPQGASDSQP